MDKINGKTLFEEDEWKVVTIDKEGWMIPRYCNLNSLVYHRCPDNDGRHYWSGLRLAKSNLCNHCNLKVPDNILTLHRLNNWDILYG